MNDKVVEIQKILLKEKSKDPSHSKVLMAIVDYLNETIFFNVGTYGENTKTLFNFKEALEYFNSLQ